MPTSNSGRAACAINQKHRHDRHGNIYDAYAHGRQDRAGSGIESSGLKNVRRVINHRVDAGNLLEDGET
jgi:hypothetical protein